MSDTLDQIRRRLMAVIAEAAEELDAERYAHERQLATALESLSQDGACQAAYRDGRSDERGRCLALIDDHLHCLSRTGAQVTALEALRIAVAGE